jgi:hypothetical protein
MTSRNRVSRQFRPLLRAAPLAALLAAGCGNYTNEDLEYMNALPQNSDLRANIPPVTGAVELANEAELARSTHDTTRGFNGLLMTLVDIVDTIRSYPPTTRTPTSRIWGPFAADQSKGKNLDWQTRMIVSRDELEPSQFDYEIAVHHIGQADTDWPVFIRGSFQAIHTARRGKGHVELLTADVRAEGLDVTDLGMLDHLEIDYQTLDEPLSITMNLLNLPDPTTHDPAPMIVYKYRANATGQGEMTFDLYGNLIPVTPQIEHMQVVSQWLSTGVGRATLTVLSGDGMGAQQTECWDKSFAKTFNDKPWSAGEDFPMPPGDPAAICPNIPPLAP